MASTPQRDLLVVILLMVALGVAWYYTGGTASNFARSGPLFEVPKGSVIPNLAIPGVQQVQVPRGDETPHTTTISNYIGTFTEDQTATPVTATLNQFIEGWRIAIPYIQKGGHIKMIIPSSLAYGCTGNKSIPPNAPLYYDVVLVNVN